jgi:hypothetical protein
MSAAYLRHFFVKPERALAGEERSEGMYARDYLVAERTLLGSVDSFLKSTVHVRPQLASRFEEIADAWIDAWLEEGGENSLEAVDATWLERYLAQLGEGRMEAERFFRAFYAWAVRENLVDASPLAHSTV